MREHDAIAVLGIPDVAVLTLVDIRVEPAIVVRVDISNKEMRNMPSKPLPAEKSEPAVFYLGHQSPQAYCTN